MKLLQLIQFIHAFPPFQYYCSNLCFHTWPPSNLVMAPGAKTREFCGRLWHSFVQIKFRANWFTADIKTSSVKIFFRDLSFILGKQRKIVHNNPRICQKTKRWMPLQIIDANQHYSLFHGQNFSLVSFIFICSCNNLSTANVQQATRWQLINCTRNAHDYSSDPNHPYPYDPQWLYRCLEARCTGVTPRLKAGIALLLPVHDLPSSHQFESLQINQSYRWYVTPPGVMTVTEILCGSDWA